MVNLPFPTSIRHPRGSGDPELSVSYGLPLAREWRLGEFSDKLLGGCPRMFRMNAFPGAQPFRAADESKVVG
ncbi:hypothetical protein SAMN02745206_00297 [Desulfacinum infernum DSM 9756]|uniref:Uncharacterized protein n=1 Tax=Desulfacinum infernum DSM 9756 TaxID=1121391 RepID=A0A1M4TJV2_9BACT|nr:hypothetical protein SAMN02745206_00297 [Desulfacinum infernum DSM 9756]